MKRRILAILLTLCMILGMMPTMAFANQPEFHDINGHWAEEVIEKWSDRDIINGMGNGRFDPNGSMTRAQAAAVFANLFKLTKKADVSEFADVKDAWYKDAIAMCVEAGIMSGVGNGKMDPDGTLTREQMFTMFANALGIKPESTSDKEFVDKNNTSNWARGYINALVNRGYISGMKGNKLAPELNINRASVMALIDSAIVEYVTEKGAEVKAPDDNGLIIVAAEDVTIKGELKGTVIIVGSNGKVTVEKTSEDAEVVVKAENVTIDGNISGTVEVATGATGTTIAGEVSKVEVTGEDATVKITGTVDSVEVDESVDDEVVEVVIPTKPSKPNKPNRPSVPEEPEISDFAPAFRSDIDADSAAKAILIYSKDLLYRDSIQNLKREYIVEDGYPTEIVNEDKLTVEKADVLVAEKKAKELEGVIPAGTGIAFEEGQLTLEGEALEKDIYYPFVVVIDEDGSVDVYDSMEYVITADDPEPKTELIRDGKGIVWPIGGATSDENYEYIGQQAAVGLADGEIPRIAILNSSRDYDTSLTYMYDTEDDPGFGTYEKNFRGFGMEVVWIPLNFDSLYYFEDVTYYPELIKSCDAVYLMGGDQMRHAKCLLNEDGTPNAYLEAIQYVIDRGGFVTGTSAGCHIMGRSNFGLGVSYDAMYLNMQGEWANISELNENGETADYVDGNNLYTYGIGLIPEGYLLESHFDARGRLGRLMVALRDGYEGVDVGIGPDESTGVQLQEIDGEMIGTIVGPRGVFFVDASEAVYSEAGSENFDVENLRIDYLTEGDTYNFETREIVIAEGKETVEETVETPYRTISVFTAYGTTKTMLSLTESTSDIAVGIAGGDDDAVNFQVTFAKGDDYEAKNDGSGYFDTPELEGYNRTSITGLVVSVEQIGEIPTEGDETAPVITYAKHYSKQYSVWVGITDDFSGIDGATVNEKTVKLISPETTLYRNPRYSKGDGEIEVTVDQDFFLTGDQVKIKGVKDRAGNEVEPQTWEKQADGSWIKVEFIDNGEFEEIPIDEDTTPPAITYVKHYSKQYSAWIGIEDDLAGIDASSVNAETVKLISDVTTLYRDPRYDDGDGEIEVTVSQDYFTAGDLIYIEGVKDKAGNAVEAQTWEKQLDGTWKKLGEDDDDDDVIEEDTTPPAITYMVHYGSPYKAWIGIEDAGSGINASTVNAETVKLVSPETTLYRAPNYQASYGEIEVVSTQDFFLVGDQVVIEGITDVAGNEVEPQIWEKQEDDTWKKIE
ncbi:MAG: S-layer homology domain-containing protein [Firmicutes bacterium]|nr:S-layer homology domain-containing protein [Bacillota bacterium]